MTTSSRESNLLQWLILVGACFFILALAVSAYWEADIRWLHFFQAWIYVATIVLSFRRSRWGYFIGISAAGLWDYTNIFATTFLYNGLQRLGEWIHTGHLQRPDLLIAIPAWLSNFLVVVGCIWGYLRLPDRSLKMSANLCSPSPSPPDSSRWTCTCSSRAISASSPGCCIRGCRSSAHLDSRF